MFHHQHFIILLLDHWWLIIQLAVFVKHTTFLLDISTKNILSLYLSWSFCEILFTVYISSSDISTIFAQISLRVSNSGSFPNQLGISMKVAYIFRHWGRPGVLPASVGLLKKNRAWHWLWYTALEATRPPPIDNLFRTSEAKVSQKKQSIFYWNIGWLERNFGGPNYNEDGVSSVKHSRNKIKHDL